MALTNAEKQRRWREKRKALAKPAPEREAGLAKLTSLRNDGNDSQKIQHAYKATEYARAHWVTHLLDLVEAYADARKKFASDKDFARWLIKNEVDHFGSPDWLAPIWSVRRSYFRNSPACRHRVYGRRWKHAG
jgi:hypothetical protein